MSIEIHVTHAAARHQKAFFNPFKPDLDEESSDKKRINELKKEIEDMKNIYEYRLYILENSHKKELQKLKKSLNDELILKKDYKSLKKQFNEFYQNTHEAHVQLLNALQTQLDDCERDSKQDQSRETKGAFVDSRTEIEELEKVLDQMKLEYDRKVKELDELYTEKKQAVRILKDRDDTEQSEGQKILKKVKECKTYVETEWPPEWENGPFDVLDDNVRIIEVEKNSDEYHTLEEKFHHNARGYRLPENEGFNFLKNNYETAETMDLNAVHKKHSFQVIKIERVQNPELWMKYYNYVKMLAKNYSKQHPEETGDMFEKANEWWAFHGTSILENLETIVKNGFQLPKHVFNNNFYGPALYTATTARYSDAYASKAEIDGKKVRQMLICRLAAGDMFYSPESANSLTEPPQQKDSVLGSPDGIVPEFVMTYNNDSIYPAYIVSYIKNNEGFSFF